MNGERAHYELATGNGARTRIDRIEKLASSTGLLPEQILDERELGRNSKLILKDFE